MVFIHGFHFKRPIARTYLFLSFTLNSKCGSCNLWGYIYVHKNEIYYILYAIRSTLHALFYCFYFGLFFFVVLLFYFKTNDQFFMCIANLWTSVTASTHCEHTHSFAHTHVKPTKAWTNTSSPENLKYTYYTAKAWIWCA